MKVRPFLLIGLLWAASAAAQGTYLYTWHGDSGLFQGSFQVTPEENQPGGFFQSQTFYSSIVITSPDQAYAYSWPGGIASGRMMPPISLSIILSDDANNIKVSALANSGWAGISEDDVHDPAHPVQKYWENGYWSSTYLPVPEPSSASLLVLSGVACMFFKRKGDSKAALSRKTYLE